MKNWIARLFGASSEAAVASTVPAVVASEPDAPASAIAPHPGGIGMTGVGANGPAGVAATHADVDAAFYRWMTGSGSGTHRHDAAPRAETQILDELARLAATPDAGANLVPRVPAVIPQLLRSLRDDSVTGADLARQLAQDVVLVAEVIREANSPYYRPATPVKTIEGAVMLLGQNGLRMLLARVSFRPIISSQGGPFSRQVAPQIWSQSEKCALAASMLAPGLGANPFEAYLAGLMQNVGMMVAFRLIDLMVLDQALPDSDPFCASLHAQARTLSSRIGMQWDFPVTVTGAIEQAGLAGAERRADPLVRSLALADRISKLRLLIDAGQLGADDPFVVDGLDEAALACLAKLATDRSSEDN